MADQIPESTKSGHVVWTVDATSYLRNLDSEDLHVETIAVHHQSAPEETETSTRISLRLPTLIVSGYCAEPREVADRVARILNAHWDEPAAPPAIDREAVGLDWRVVAKLAGEHGVRYRTNRAFEQFATAILSTLSADAIRQGEGDLKAREEGYRAGYLHALGLARAEVPTKDFERDVGAYMADFLGGRP